MTATGSRKCIATFFAPSAGPLFSFATFSTHFSSTAADSSDFRQYQSYSAQVG